MPETLGAASIWLIPGCPLAAAVLVALFGKTVFRCGGHRIVIAALVVSCLLSLGQLWNLASAARHAPPEGTAESAVAAAPAERPGPIATGYEWASAGGFHVHLDVQIDALSAVMLAMVTFVSLLVIIYSSGYMQGDPGYSRFFAELALFVFSMCMLVMARNLVVLFVFWEAVGMCSYLLIGFWFERPAASAAAVKAFVMNRIGDAAFLIGLFLTWRTFHSLNFGEIFHGADVHEKTPEFLHTVLTICLCLFVGACGKSAQFPLHLWLPDAMEGPSPVSALIHAATMVTAGVYMVARFTPLFVLAPEAQAAVATIGGITALLAALIALTQNDLKRILAYSTVSQLGYMFLALGSAAAGEAFAAAAVTAAIFHMFTHAFFKSLLFLSAGNVMHAMGNVVDIRQFSGLKKVLPVTNITFLCGALALAGFPLLSGFWSKDEIFGLLLNATHHGPYHGLFQVLFAAAFLAAILTAFYTFRAYFRTFHGPTRVPAEAFAHAHHGNHAAQGHGNGHLPAAAPHASSADDDLSQIHEGPSVMKWPLTVLAVFAVAVGFVVGPTDVFAGWIAQTPRLVPGQAEEFHWLLAGASALAALGGIGVAWLMYMRLTDLPQKVRNAAGPLYSLSLNKFYLDEIAAVLVSFPVNAIAFLSLVADQGVIDRFVDWAGSVPAEVGKLVRPSQNGVIQSYALMMFFGLAGLALFLTTVVQFWVVGGTP